MHSAARFVALLALLVALAAPRGFMPVLGADGFAIELCSGAAQASYRISPDDPDYKILRLIHGVDDEGQPMSDDGGGCAFASVDSPGSPPPFLIPRDRERPAALTENVAHASPFLAQHRHRPPATGPPQLA